MRKIRHQGYTRPDNGKDGINAGFMPSNRIIRTKEEFSQNTLSGQNIDEPFLVLQLITKVPGHDFVFNQMFEYCEKSG